MKAIPRGALVRQRRDEPQVSKERASGILSPRRKAPIVVRNLRTGRNRSLRMRRTARMRSLQETPTREKTDR